MIELRDNQNGTWTVLHNGKVGAKITIAATGRAPSALSIDVQPAVDAKCVAIAFGADVLKQDERVMEMGHAHNGTINPDARPFMCVDIRPLPRRRKAGS